MDNKSDKISVSHPIKWMIPDNISSVYSTHMAVQQTESEIILLFFELQLPLVFGTSEEKQAQIDQVAFVDAKCVARIVVPPSRIREFTKLLSERFGSDTPEPEKQG